MGILRREPPRPPHVPTGELVATGTATKAGVITKVSASQTLRK